MESTMEAGENANAVLQNVLTNLDLLVGHLRSQSENDAANEIALKSVEIVKAFNDATARWDSAKFSINTTQASPGRTSWATITAKGAPDDKNNKWIKFRPCDGIKNTADSPQDSSGEDGQETAAGRDEDMRVVWILNWGKDRALSDVTKVLSQGPIFSMGYSAELDAVYIIFQHAASARAVLEGEHCHKEDHGGASMFGAGCTITPGAPYPEDEGIRRMCPPLCERRRLTFARSQLFANGMTQQRFRKDIEQEVGATNVELVWLFNTGNATVVFPSTDHARRVCDQFRAQSRVKGPYRDVQVYFSHDPCERPFCLVTQLQPREQQAKAEAEPIMAASCPGAGMAKMPVKTAMGTPVGATASNAAPSRGTPTDADGWQTVTKRRHHQ